jgi:hypothetical protein
MISMYIAIALKFSATVYGFGEHRCGDASLHAVACDSRAVTASGERFDPVLITAAVPASVRAIARPVNIYVRNYLGGCTKIHINDKKSARFVGNGGLDLSPAAVRAITGSQPSKTWSGQLTLCYK